METDSYTNICLICLHLSISVLWSLNGSSEKHSSSPTHLWFHLGRWQHSQLYVPSGHMWSTPVKEMCAVSKEGKEKFCIPQEGKGRMHLVANCRGYGKVCHALLWLVMPKQTMSRRSLKHSEDPSPVITERLSQSQTAGLAAAFTWPMWLIFFVAVLLLLGHTLQHIFVTKSTIIMKLVLVKTHRKIKKQFKINKITLLNFQYFR